MDTIAALSTPAVVSAIGIVRMSGDKAIEIADRVFTPASGAPLCERKSRALVYGTVKDVNGDIFDYCLCTISRAPNSYTGEDTAEFQCHGSPVVLRLLLETLFSHGARQALAGEFTKRAFLNGKIPLTGAESVINIIEAESAESAKNAAGQLGGAISRRADALYEELRNIVAHYYAIIDYPDDEIENFEISGCEGSLLKVSKELKALLDTYSRGKYLDGGIPAAIIGRPNVGKSSLLNALLGYDRAIVSPIPGTTRDTVRERIKLGRVILNLSDTAGIRETEDYIEKLGVERSLKQIEEAKLVIAVIDAAGEITDEDREIIAKAEAAENGILIVNKTDLNQNAYLPETKLPIVYMSAVNGEGIDELKNAVEKLFPLPVVPSGEIITNARHADALNRALTSVNAALDASRAGFTPDVILTEAENAMEALGELDGKTIKSDITDRIFANFCVGK